MTYDNSNREYICSQLSVFEVVKRYSGAEPDRHNRCACPLHGGKNHNFTFYPKTNSFYCFTCGAGGDVIKFVSECLGIGYGEAIKQIDEDYRLGLFDRKRTTYNSHAKRIAAYKKEQEAKLIKEQQDKISYNRLINYYKWLVKQPKTKDILHDIDFISNKLDYHLNLDEHPINYDVVALIRALCSKHRERRL